MNEHQQLLEAARTFCDPKTGEVLQRIPEELMGKLRVAKLARGVPGRRNERTGTYATWFVFLSGDIRDQVAAQWREANRVRRQRRAAARKAQPVAAGAAAKPAHASAPVRGQIERKQSAK